MKKMPKNKLLQFSVKYKEEYTHFTEVVEQGLLNKLILNRAILGGKTQKPDEGCNLTTQTYELVEMKQVFSGEKRFYFSTEVIESAPLPSLDENMRVIKEFGKKMSEKFETPTFDVLARNIQEAVFETIEESGY